MPDWKTPLKTHLAGLNLDPARESEILEELSQHLEEQFEELLAHGFTTEEAKRLALEDFQNNQSLAREFQRIERRTPQEPVSSTGGIENFMHNTYRDIRYAIRMLMKNPGLTTIAVITLALGIGMNTSMFSFLNELLLRPLPYPQAEQLVKIYRSTPQNSYGSFSPADFLDLKREESGFGEFAAFQHSRLTLSEPGRPAEWMEVSANFFNVLGIQPKLGRLFRSDEEIQGNHRVVLISQGFWKDRFGASPDVIGKTLQASGETFQIIGVLPPSATDHRFFGPIGCFSPLSWNAEARMDRKGHRLSVIGRRNTDIPATQGEAFIAATGARLADNSPNENQNCHWRTETMQNQGMSPAGKALLFMLLGLSTFVLLIACSNLANLLLARTMERVREFAVRSALGASKVQLVRPLFAESLLLAVAGGTGALLVARWTTDWLQNLILNRAGLSLEFPMDWRVLSFALAASVLTLLSCGVAPALFTVKLNTNEILKNNARGATTDRGHQRLRHLLIIGQFSLAMILLAGAGFFIRGSINVMKKDHGWKSDQVVQGSIQLPQETYPTGKEITAFYQKLLERLTQLPGVEAASISYGLPFLGLRGSSQYIAERSESASGGREITAKINGITPSYFNVTGTRLVTGRFFNSTDTATSMKVAIINESMARLLFPNGNAVGQRLAHPGIEPKEWMEIVGIVGDVSSCDVAQAPSNYQVYHPMTQKPSHGGVVALRTTHGDPESMAKVIRETVANLNPDLPVRELMSANRRMDHILSQMYLCQQLLLSFAVLGLFLAALGIYGVMARMVAQRTSEIGIRMALGAQILDIVRLILGSGIRLAIIGAAAGLLGTFGLSKLLASVFPTMQTNGGFVVTGATALLIGMALLACYLPSRKASKVDPNIALRAE